MANSIRFVSSRSPGKDRRAAGRVGSGIALFALAAALFGSVQAATVPTGLPNGVRVVVEQRPMTETVAVRIVLGSGYLDDPPGRRGVAELHARLLSRGTQARNALELARATEALGGRLNCYSDLRHTMTGIVVPAENLRAAFTLLAEVVRTPRFDPMDLAKEKALLIAAIRGSRDDPSSLVWDETVRTLFPSHPLHQMARLEPTDVQVVTLEDIVSFHARALTPSRVAVIAVGRCAPEEVEHMASDAFRDLEKHEDATGRTGSPEREEAARGTGGADRSGSPEGGREVNPDLSFKATVALDTEPLDLTAPLARPPLPPPPPLPADVHRSVHARTAQAQIMTSLPTPGVADEDLPAYAVLRFVLGGFEERLSAEIREKRGYAYWLTLNGVTLPTAGWIGVYTGARKKHLGEIESIVRSELRRIASEPISAEELTRARQYLTTAEARLDATNSGRCSTLTGALVDGRPLRSYEERIARLEGVTPAQVQGLARRLFAGKALAVVTLR